MFTSAVQSAESAHSIPSTSKRRPCDRCHIIKEKCHWLRQGLKDCHRCSRLGLRCQTDRPVGRAGRKPKLPAGNRLRLRSTGCDPSPSPIRGCASLTIPACEPSSLSPSTQYSSATTGESPYLTDEHELIPRPPSRNELPGHPLSLALFPDLTRLESQLLDAVLNKQTDIDRYIIGPSFRDQHQQAFLTHLETNLPFLKDAFIACAPLLIGRQQLQRLTNGQHVGYKRAAAAIQMLRFMDVYQPQDMTTVMMLGISVVTFALHHSGGELLLCRHILSIVKTFYQTQSCLPQQLGSDGISYFICLLGTETVECLLQCQVPTIRVRPGELDQVVDRFIGISASLLTPLYDLCELSRRIYNSAGRCGNTLMDETIKKSLDTIGLLILRWHPTIPPGFLEGCYTSTEVVFMLSQAKVLRLAASLILHRLQYAFGTQDAKATAISNAIRDELDMVIRLTGRSIPFVDFAYLVACFECTTPTDRQVALEPFNTIFDFSVYVNEGQRRRLVSFWAARDDETHLPIYWNDLAASFGGLNRERM